jgi:plasmid stabilization system protein ParE
VSQRWFLTRQAEQSLIDIADWTFETFGPRQADAYRDDLLEVCAAIAAGTAQTRDCSVLLGNKAGTGLRYARAGGHFLIFTNVNGDMVVVDILHSASDLPRHIERLSR